MPRTILSALTAATLKMVHAVTALRIIQFSGKSSVSPTVMRQTLPSKGIIQTVGISFIFSLLLNHWTIGTELPIWICKQCIVDKKAMIRSRYNRIPHSDPNTKWERDTYN